MKTATRFTFPVASFRHIETPFQKKGYKDFLAVVDISHLPDLSAWRKINVRDPKLTGAVPKAIRESVRDNVFWKGADAQVSSMADTHTTSSCRKGLHSKVPNT
jgi:hypothetical protein